LTLEFEKEKLTELREVCIVTLTGRDGHANTGMSRAGRSQWILCRRSESKYFRLCRSHGSGVTTHLYLCGVQAVIGNMNKGEGLWLNKTVFIKGAAGWTWPLEYD
jgi:hypothetical protein